MRSLLRNDKFGALAGKAQSQNTAKKLKKQKLAVKITEKKSKTTTSQL
jgi:hypothetical protein